MCPGNLSEYAATLRPFEEVGEDEEESLNYRHGHGRQWLVNRFCSRRLYSSGMGPFPGGWQR